MERIDFMEKSFSDSYKAAGVDVTAGYKAVELMKAHVARTQTAGSLSGIGGFGGLFELDLTGMEKPVLVSGTDGVGTKLKLAFLLNKHDTVGIDCVAMCVNDIICAGAKPLVFLDYVAVGKNYPEKVAQIVSGRSGRLRTGRGCALVGGETAEMPGFYPEDEYDLAGFSVGAVDKSKILDMNTIAEGDVIIGLASSGVHSNGFSLVRKVFDVEHSDLGAYADRLGKPLGEALLTPTRIYVKPILRLLEQVKVKSISHITGGGFYGKHSAGDSRGIPGCYRPGCGGCTADLPADSGGWQYSGAGYVQHLQHGHRHVRCRQKRRRGQSGGDSLRLWGKG